MPKIVIDIDDSLYDAIQTEFYVNGMRSGKTLLEKLTTTIRNGTPLDDYDFGFCEDCTERNKPRDNIICRHCYIERSQYKQERSEDERMVKS